MSRLAFRLFVWMGALLILTSCAKARYGEANVIDTEGRPFTILPEEVSVGDWMTYVVATSFQEHDQVVWLGDHYDKVKSKLPVSGMGGWNDYTIRAFLRPGDEYGAVEFSNACNDHMAKLAVHGAAGDSITQLKLMDLPITGITYEQAQAYLAYLQEILNACDDFTRGKYRYECFLPSPEQFDMFHSKLDSTNAQGCNLFNYKHSLCAACPNGKEWSSHPVTSTTGKEPTYTQGYFPDQFGLYNYNGNVAEMTSVNGIAKGGSCVHYAIEAYKGKQQTYTEPAMWLGFRIWYKRFPVSKQE